MKIPYKEKFIKTLIVGFSKYFHIIFCFVFNEVFKEYLLEQNFVKVKSVLAKSGRCSSAAYISADYCENPGLH